MGFQTKDGPVIYVDRAMRYWQKLGLCICFEHFQIASCFIYLHRCFLHVKLTVRFLEVNMKFLDLSMDLSRSPRSLGFDSFTYHHPPGSGRCFRSTDPFILELGWDYVVYSSGRSKTNVVPLWKLWHFSGIQGSQWSDPPILMEKENRKKTIIESKHVCFPMQSAFGVMNFKAHWFYHAPCPGDET